jgi:hypothetical protein
MKPPIRLLAGALAAMGLAAGLTMGGTGTARADVVPPSGTWSEIFSPYLQAQGNTLCFDDPSGSTARDQPMQLWRCHGYASNGAMERWAIIPVLDSVTDLPIRDWTNQSDPGSPLYYVYNLAANECLTGSATLALGQQLTLDPCTYVGTRWELSSDNAISSSGTDFQLHLWTSNPGFQDCASASNFTDSNGTRLVIEPCSLYDTSQIWNLG